MVCCSFGHKDVPASVFSALEHTVEDLIQNAGVNEFLVGNQGSFDGMVHRVLKKAKSKYPSITYHVVLAYMPKEKDKYQLYEYGETLLPVGIESIHPKFAISWRNKWMIRKSDVVVCYVNHSWGGAAQFVEYARRQGKPIINIGNMEIPK